MVPAGDALKAATVTGRVRMSPAWLIVGASFLFATMGVCVKLASADYPAGEIVLYRGLTGALMMLAWRAGKAAPSPPACRRCISGAPLRRDARSCLWFYAIGNLPLATAMTLNYMSSVWMALFLLGGAIALGTSRVDGRLIATVLVGFAGVALILRPTIAAAAALVRPDRPALGRDLGDRIPASDRARARRRARVPDRLLFLARRRRRRRR